MSDLKERAKISQKISNVIIPLCSNGDKAAEAYLKRVFFIVRMLDDLQDEDFHVDKKDIIKGFFLLLADIPNNEFYQKHINSLLAIHVLSFNAWQDANKWENSNTKLKQQYAHVLRDQICELFILVAFLTGGESLMKKASIKVRTTFLKEM